MKDLREENFSTALTEKNFMYLRWEVLDINLHFCTTQQQTGRLESAVTAHASQHKGDTLEVGER
ncbi:hypothetical protein E2C01_101888 [Portunus trituberculatus]|uniref:Uncharacterized protein n=1 Tax=Portunus trituberculatus TaxID=210409 RepID=A0A5B7KAZ1_PORTR|nr:hypothetical protein [Portunus trituberculatus]